MSTPKRLITPLMGLIVFVAVFSVNNAEAEAATCETDGSIHGYAGLIVNSRYRDFETGTHHQSNNTRVNISTRGSTASPPGNVVRLGAGPEGVAQREHDVTFDQISLGYCDYGANGDTTNVVLGHNITTTSHPSGGSSTPWAIDCDASIHGVGHEQLIDVDGVGTPDGARAMYAGVPSGYGWQAEIVRPANGKTTKITITYREPPPKDAHDPDGNIEVTCTQFRLVGVKDDDRSGQAVKYDVWSGASPSDAPVNSGWLNGNSSWFDHGVFSPSGVTFTVRLYSLDAEGNTKPGNYTQITRGSPSPCYSASCSINMTENVVGNPPGGPDVNAGQDTGTSINVTSLGEETLRGGSENLSLIINDIWTPLTNPGSGVSISGSGARLHQDITKFVTKSGNFTVRAPSTINNHPFNVTVRYKGHDVGSCSVNVRTFKYFDLGTHASVNLSPTEEDPIQAIYGGNGNHEDVPAEYAGGISVGYSAEAQRTPYGQTQQTVDSRISTGITPGVYSYTYNVPPLRNAGDSYCVLFNIVQSRGWIGPNNIFGETSPEQATSCVSIHDKPYIRAYGGDVVAGSNFVQGDACNNTNPSEINTYRSASAGKSGSGVQFAAMALGQIKGFSSASLRSASPISPVGLTFSNTIGVDNTSPSVSANDGGSYDGSPICAADYFGTTQKENIQSISTTNFDIASLDADDDGKQTLINTSGNFKVHISNSAAGSSFGLKHTLFVDGDVVLSDDIIYSGLGPNFSLVVRGDIYIDRSVVQLDGLFVAQPRDDGGGNVYTCTNEGNQFNNSNSDLWDNCRSRLVVNGAVIAGNVKLQRVIDSLRDSVAGEPYGSSRAAEIFILNPEIYLNSPVLKQNNVNSYDYITALPPIL